MELCNICLGEKQYMKEKANKGGFVHINCNICDDEGLIDNNLFIDKTDMDY